MRWVVTKCPVDLPGAPELVGCFTDPSLARQACRTPGTYFISEVQDDRAYKSGQILNVSVVEVLDRRTVAAA